MKLTVAIRLAFSSLHASHGSTKPRVLRNGVVNRREQGIALVIAMTAVAILAVMLADMHENTATAFTVAMDERDHMRAEYLAVSAINLTRLLVAREPEIRQVVAPVYQVLMGGAPPQLPVWKYANELLKPFCDYKGAEELGAASGMDFASTKGLGETGGTCQLKAVAENSKINANNPLFYDGDAARRSTAMQLFALMGGYQAPSPYDPIFTKRDADSQFNTRLDIISGIIDWWDYDQERTVFDPGAAQVTTAGTEDDVYRVYKDPYFAKNAPLDSVEELRLVRGVSDDFWATFVQPDSDAPEEGLLTVYGSGAVNPNEARPETLLARVCSFATAASLCVDTLEAAKFVQVLKTVRSMFPIPWFRAGGDFVAFLEGKGGSRDLYPMLSVLLGPNNPLMFRPITIPQNQRGPLTGAFVTSAQIISFQANAQVGRSRVTIRSVVNFHDRWTPPPPNSGAMPGLGIFYYWRVE